MADLPNAARLEVELYRTINAFFKPYLQRESMRAPGWKKLEDDIAKSIRPMLHKVRQQAAEGVYKEFGEGEQVPKNLFSRAADRAGDLAADLVQVTKRRWTELKAQYAKLGKPVSKTAIAEWKRKNFGRKRAKVIAVTELSFAHIEGELRAARRLGLTGTWVTERRPCKRCAAMSGKPEKVWRKIYPKGPGTVHPACRCRANWKRKAEAVFNRWPSTMRAG